MKEDELFDPMIEYLNNNDYKIFEQHRGKERGTDIVAIKQNSKLFLELKGDSTAPDVDFGTVIYQIMKQMNPHSSDEFAIVVSEKYRKHAIRCKCPLQKLKIKVYIISEKGVELIL